MPLINERNHSGHFIFGAVLLVISGMFIISVTLTPTPPYDAGGPLCIICGDRGVADFILNILLFVPVGIGLQLCGVSMRRTAILVISACVLIEGAQLDLVAGRDASLGDLLANTSGALLGFWLTRHRWWWCPTDGAGKWRWLGVGVALNALLVCGLMLLDPVPPETRFYYPRWTPRFEHLGWYEGTVRQAKLGGLEMNVQPDSIPSSDAALGNWLGKPIAVTGTAAPPPPLLSPIFSVYDDRGDEVMLFGALRSDLVYRYQMRAGRLRFASPFFRVRNAFADLQAGEPFRLRWSFGRSGYCLEINDSRRCGGGFSAGHLWALVLSLPPEWGLHDYMQIMTLLAVVIPLGLLASNRRHAAGVVAFCVLSLLLVPRLIGFAPTPWIQIGAAVAGIAAGLLIRKAALAMRSA